MALFNRIIAIGLVALCFYQCTPKTPEPVVSSRAHYAIYVRAKDGQEYLMEVPSLTAGFISPTKDGINMNNRKITREMIVRDGHYYYQNYNSGQFFQSKVEAGGIAPTDSLPMENFSIENFNWVGADSLLLLGLDTTFAHARYYLVQTAQMKTLRHGRIALPQVNPAYNSMSIGFSYYRKDTLVMGYNYHHAEGEEYTTSDTVCVAAMTWSDMVPFALSKDTRSVYPGGVNTIQSSSFTDEHGDFYFATEPGILLGRRPEKPSAIMRVKKGAISPDPDYFFDVSGSAVGQHGYGLWYLGHGKVIVRSEKKGAYTGWNDYHNVHQFSFHVLDLATKSVTRLPLPPDKGGRRECVLVENGHAFISVNSSTEGNFIWTYGIEDGSLKKGLELEENVDYIFRMDRLK